MIKQTTLLIIFFLLSVAKVMGEANDSTKGSWSFQVAANVSHISHGDEEMQKFLHSYTVNYYDLRAKWRASKNTDNPYDVAMGRPYIVGGVMYADYSRLKIRRPESEYNSHVEQIITFYGGMQFDVLHTGRWTVDVDFINGLGYCPHPFNERKNKDQEIIGSQFSFFIGGGAHIGYNISPRWRVSAGVDLRHYSNGTLDRPNIGANTIGGTVAVCYNLERQDDGTRAQKNAGMAERENEGSGNRMNEIYVETTAGVALKALKDNFEIYHESHNPLYASFTTMIAPMWRYHRLFASGIGLDYTYANYVYKIRDLDAISENKESKYSPHILGLSLRHEVFYKHVSMAVGVGVYLNKHTGHSAVKHEGKTYQNIGLRYSLPFTNDRLFLGYNIKAHNFSKVDCVHLIAGYRIPIKI